MPYDESGKYQVGKLSFDPKTVLTRTKGSPKPNYLEVKYRLVMLREMFPEASIETELVYHDPEKHLAVARATVTLPPMSHGGPWQAKTVEHKMEERKDFHDYVEKACTGAIGRALTAIGIGVQYSGVEYDYEDDAVNQKEFKGVDTPVDLAKMGKLADVRAELKAQVDRLGTMKVIAESQRLFKKTSSSELSEAELGELVEALKAIKKE